MSSLIQKLKNRLTEIDKGFRLSSKGFILLVGVSFCIKAIAQRHFITNILIQSKGLKMNDICSRNRAFFIHQLFITVVSIHVKI